MPILMRRRHSFMTIVTSASPAFPMLASAAWKSAQALRLSFALRCVASSFPMFAHATWMNALALRILRSSSCVVRSQTHMAAGCCFK